MMYGLRWTETDRNDQFITKEKNFRTEQERARFVAKLQGKDNFIAVRAYSDPKQAEVPAPAPATKTSGVFKVVTDRNPDFYYVGASSQIEIAFRDYMNWVTKGKAPKAIQEEADRHDRNPEIFRFEVLEEMEGNRAELNERKKAWKDQLAGNEPEPVEEPETDELDPGDMTVEQRNELILERLQTGDSVADVAEAFGVSKSTVYNIRNSQ